MVSPFEPTFLLTHFAMEGGGGLIKSWEFHKYYTRLKLIFLADKSENIKVIDERLNTIQL